MSVAFQKRRLTKKMALTLKGPMLSKGFTQMLSNAFNGSMTFPRNSFPRI